MGLLKTPEREENPLSPSTNEALKDPSPFKVKILDKKVSSNQSHYREVPRWELFMEQELRFGLDLGRFGNF